MEPKVAVQLWNVESRAMIEPPLPLETKVTAPIQLWNSFVFQLSNKRIEVWLSNILVNLWRISRALKYIVSFTHHRWRWKLLGWQTSWVLISVGRDLRHRSWKRKEPKAQIKPVLLPARPLIVMCFILSEMIGFLFVISFLGLFILVPLRMVLALVSKV
jgi:hypothetical protein